VRNRFAHLRPVLAYLGALFWVFGFVLLVPIPLLLFYRQHGHSEVPSWCFLAPAGLALVVGLLLKRGLRFGPLDTRASMLLCALAWVAVSAVAALPLWLGLRSVGTPVSYLDAYFEAVSGFTTTGITMLRGLDAMPRSMLFWRALMQWVGGLGILTFFLLVVTAGGSAPGLFSAESHKVLSKRPAPGFFHTVRILWLIYASFTALIGGLLFLQGLSLYDSICHSFTALSTGGYSPYDASIAHYQQAGYRHFVGIEYTLVLGMLLGGMSFLVHYRVLTGDLRALWDNAEVRLWWFLLAAATGLVALDHWLHFGFGEVERTLRAAAFQVVAIATTTGFATKDIAARWFPPFAKQLFLVLMVIGGCVGSTAGGIKVLRIGVLIRMVHRQVRRVIHGPSAVVPVVLDGEMVDMEELRRIAALFFAWVALLAFGAGVTALLSELGPLEAASGMFSALGNIGPCYIPAQAMAQLHPAVKLTYIAGMLAGRLEILPILLLFSRRAWH